jgi:hypothetical protein
VTVCVHWWCGAQCLLEFPFFHTVYRIAFQGAAPETIVHLDSPVLPKL